MNCFCVFIHYTDPYALHLAHNDIKVLDFVLQPRFHTLRDARRASIQYINDFFDETCGVGVWKHLPNKIPITPVKESGWNHFKDGFICTDTPGCWKLSVWEKNLKKGLIYNNSKVTKLFDVDILQVYEKPLPDYRDEPTISGSPPSLSFSDGDESE